jgi:hypothetical protein
MNTMIKALMWIWGISGVFSLMTAVYMVATGDVKSSYLFFAFTFVSGLMFALNKRRLKIYSTNKNQAPSPKQGKQKK